MNTRRHSLTLAVTLGFFAWAAQAQAVDVTGDYVISVKPLPPPPPLTLQLVGGQIDCKASPGSIVGAAYTQGGNGNPVIFTISAGNSVDFAISGSLIIVGTSGIRPATCGTITTVTVKATQL